MKTLCFTVARILGILILGGIPALAPSLFAQKSTRPQESRITVGGSARIYGNWACKGNALVETTPDVAGIPLPGFPGGIRLVRVIVPVSGFDCDDSIVGKRLRKALKEKEHPEIHFNMCSYEIKDEAGATRAGGDFTIAGATREVDLDAKITPLERKGIIVSGSIEILMADYGIRPPDALFGLIKVHNDVSVKFYLVVSPPEKVFAKRAAKTAQNLISNK